MKYAILKNGLITFVCNQCEKAMEKKEKTPHSGLVNVPFCKTRCGVDFYINTGHSTEICGVLTENKIFKTDFFEFFFFSKAQGYLLLNYKRIELHDNMVLLLSPHQQQEWHVSEANLDYTFLIFREDFMRTFLVDKFFTYRLLYCYQNETPPYINIQATAMDEYIRLLGKIKFELQNTTADSYNIIVSILYYLLLIINREYASIYHLPVNIPKNNYAYQFKELLEQHIQDKQRVADYADMMHVSRATLNKSVMEQFGVPASHLLKQRLLEALKNGLLFGNRTISQLSDDFNFSDPSHLMRFFKQQTGKTFSQFADDYKNGIYD